jgi:hypothetical protein
VGRNDIEDALKRLDKLTQDEARMAIAENLKGAQDVSVFFINALLNTSIARRQGGESSHATSSKRRR